MGKNVGGKGYGEAGRLWDSLSRKGSSRSPTEEAAYKYGLGAWAVSYTHLTLPTIYSV